MTQQLTDDTRSDQPEREEALVAYAVFADYDGNAPDSSDEACFATEELAKKAAALGKERFVGHGGKWYDVPLTAYCEGWEWCKKYATHRVLVPTTDTVWRSLGDWVVSESNEEHDTDPADEGYSDTVV